MPGKHVLLDHENVQPTEDELRAMVPDATQVWVFHGPQQRQVKQRFASFGAVVTTVPISRTGKNALDFHLAFYMGFIASRNRASAVVVVANDKGYEPVLAHAKTMGFAVRQQRCGRPKPAAVKTKPASKSTAAGKAAAEQAATKTVATKKSAAMKASAVQQAQEQAPSMPSKKAAPGMKTSGDESIEVALGNLIAAGVVSFDAKNEVSYPAFAPLTGAGSAGA